MTRKPNIHTLALWAALPMARMAQVESRLQMILKPNANRRSLTRGGVAVGLASVLTLTLAAAQTAPPSPALPPPPDVKTLQYDVRDLGGSDSFSGEFFLSDTGGVAGMVFNPKPTGGSRLVCLVETPGQPRLMLGEISASDLFRPESLSSAGEMVGTRNGDKGQTWYVGTAQTLTPFRAMPAFQQLTAAGFTLNGLSDLNSAGSLLLNGENRLTHTGQPFVWQGGRLTKLPPLPGAQGEWTSATALNNLGWAAGTSGKEAVLWKGTVPLGLGIAPGYVRSEATGLNERGDVVGRLYRNGEYGVSPFATDGRGGRSHAFFWHDGTMQDLGSLPGWQYADPAGVNDAGQVVGTVQSIDPAPKEIADKMQANLLRRHPSKHGTTRTLTTSYVTSSQVFLWQKGKMYDLQQFLPKNSRWQLSRAFALNNRGQIVALAFDNGLPSREWKVRAVLLTPRETPMR